MQDKSDIYNSEDKKSTDEKLNENVNLPSFMKRGATTTITMGNESFTVVDPAITESLIIELNNQKEIVRILRETVNQQSTKISELTRKINEQSAKINKIGGELTRITWRENGIS